MAAGVLTLHRLYLGMALKRLRAESGKTLDELAAAIGKSRARLITVLDGKGTLTTKELAALLDLLGAPPVRKNELLELGIEARKRPARRPYTDLLPEPYERLADLESMATEIWSYERGIIPGLLQIPEYIEALMADADGIWWESSWEERRNRITFRLERQKVMLAQPEKIMHFVISDEALRTEVGGPEIMRRQLEHLLSLIDDRPNVGIRVLSSTAPHNPVPSGGMVLLRLGDALPRLALLPVAYGPSTYVDDPLDTERLFRARSRIETLAMGPDESRQVIADLARGT